MGISLEKCDFGFSKSAKLKSVTQFEFMYNSSQYCHAKSRLNKEKLSVGGSLKK